jgi:hypothetical protein
LGGFLRNPPLLQHTGAGQFTITNYNDTKTYGVFTTTGNPQAGTSVTDDVVSMGDVFGEYKVSYAQNPDRGTTFSRLEITYTMVNEPVWVPCTPPPPELACCVKCDGTDWDCCGRGTPCVDGTLCCKSCTGGSYEDNYVPKKDPVPAGYTEAYGEWVKIDNPAGDTRVATPEPMTIGSWPENYYVEFYGVDPETDPLVSVIFYDESDDPYLFFSYPTDEKIYFVKNKGVVEMRVRDIDGILPNSRWEIEVYTDESMDDVVWREEGYVGQTN